MTKSNAGTYRRNFASPFTVSLITLIATGALSGTGSSARAEDANSSAIPDSIVVTGTRLQNQQSIATKRDSKIIIDSISQDEIGRQPDFNIADAVRRIPGVNTVRDEEEGLYLSVRGLNPDFTFVTLDGGALASLDAGNPGRRVSVEAIPSTVISRTDVYKTRSAEMDGNTIGGQVNFVTRSAFDADGLYGVASGSIGHFTADKFDRRKNDPAIRLDGTISNTFGSDNAFGIVVAGSYFKRDQDEERALHFYDATTGGPNFPIWNGIESPQVRTGGFMKLEYRPSDRLSMALSGNYFEQIDDFQRSSVVLGANTVPQTSPGAGTGSSIYSHNLESLVTKDGKQQYGLTYNLDYKMTDNTSARMRTSYSRGRAHFGTDLSNRSDIRFVYVGPAGGNNYTYQLLGTDQPPRISFVTPASAGDPANFALNRITYNVRDTNGTVVDLDGVVDHSFGDSGYDLKAGARYRSLKRRVNDDNRRYDYIGTNRVLLSQFGRFSSSYTSPGAPQPQPIVDNAAIIDFRNRNPTLFREVVSDATILGSDYEVEESIYAGFLSVGFAQGAFAWKAGARVEATDVNALGYSSLVSGSPVYTQITDANDYVNVLPSAGVTYNFSDALVLRGAYSRALGRANLPDLRTIPGVSEVTGVTTISGGNTTLAPRLSDNFDLSLEYYFDGGRSLMSAAVFHKRIKNEIFQLDQRVTTSTGPVIVRQPINAEGSTLTGFELNMIKDKLDFLPSVLADFGVSANYTYVDAKSKVLAANGTARSVGFLVEQPEHLVNAALFYQRGPFEGRVSYNYTGDFASVINATSASGDSRVAAFETIDAQVRWRFTDQLTMMVDGRNLTNAKNFTHTGPNASQIADYSVFGRAYFVGLTYRY